MFSFCTAKGPSTLGAIPSVCDGIQPQEGDKDAPGDKVLWCKRFNPTFYWQWDFAAAGRGSEHMLPVLWSSALCTHQILRIGIVLSCLQGSFDQVIIAGNQSEQ